MAHGTTYLRNYHRSCRMPSWRPVTQLIRLSTPHKSSLSKCPRRTGLALTFFDSNRSKKPFLPGAASSAFSSSVVTISITFNGARQPLCYIAVRKR